MHAFSLISMSAAMFAEHRSIVEVYPVLRSVCVLRFGGVAKVILSFFSMMLFIVFPAVLFLVLCGSHLLWCAFTSP